MMKLLSISFIVDKNISSCSFTFTVIFILLFILVTAYYSAAQLRRASEVAINYAEQHLEVVCYTPTATRTNYTSNFLPDANDIKVSEELVPANDFHKVPIPSYMNQLPKLNTNEVGIYKNLAMVDELSKVAFSAREMYVGTEEEALKAVQMALKMQSSLRFNKAKKLIQHAMVLQPLHPEVINHYAEFLEEEDILEADLLYTRALIVSPGHNRAIANRLRTAPLVESIDQEELERIDRKRADLLRLDLNTPTLKRLKKEVYFLHIHHTLAIEGNTMSLAETRTVAETGLSIPGKSIAEHNEVLGLQSALIYVKGLIDSFGPTTVSDVLQIHKRVLGNVDPIMAGTFRRTQVFVGVHVPPPASEVEDLMKEYVAWLQSDEVRTLHPVKKAALAHHRIAYIHPFVDGNGRTARLIMNAILMGAGYPPVIIRKQDRTVYYDALQIANEGDVRPLVRFLTRCTECTLDMFLNAGVSHDHGNCLRALEEDMTGTSDIISL